MAIGLLGGMRTDSRVERCRDCEQDVAAYDVIHLSISEKESRVVCTRCFNKRVAGIDFDHPTFEPVVLADVAGNVHTFYFTTRHGGSRLALEAFEVEDGHPAGYQFQVLDDPDEDPIKVFQRLFERMRRALARRHIEKTEHGPQIAKSAQGWIVRGQIDWDEDEDGRVPRLIIDGKSYTWREVGHLLSTFEGFEMKMEIHDKSEER